MRFRLLLRLIGIGLFVVWMGLFVTQVVHGRGFRQQADRNRTRLVYLPAARGAILDRHGIPLAEDRLSFSLLVFPQELKDPPLVWERLSPLVGLSPGELNRRYRREYQAPFYPVTLIRDLPRELSFLLEEERGRLPGVLIQPIPRRSYPLGAAVGPVVGFVGLIGPEELTRLKPYGYTVRDRVGKQGLEKTYDRLLRGQGGGLHLEVDALGKLVRQIGSLRPRRGHYVTVSLDSRLQAFCYQLMEDLPGAVVVLDAQTGQVLSLVSSPAYDPNAFVQSEVKGEEIRLYLTDERRLMFNRATRSAVPPGSTFKALVAYQALLDRKIRPDTHFVCPGYYRLGNALFRCWQEEGHGTQNVLEALMHSCNVFFYSTGRLLGAEGIAQAARRFGLGQPTGIDLPGEGSGFVPDPDWMRKAYRQPWQEGDTVSFAIGQAALQVTPLQMAQAFAALGREGAAPEPHLLLQVEDGKLPRGGNGLQIHFDPEALRPVKLGLERVVADPTGTGRLARVPEVRLAGKTGTAQTSQGPSHAWFCGYAPAQNPKVSFAVFLEHGGKGGLSAAALAGELVEKLKELEYL